MPRHPDAARPAGRGDRLGQVGEEHGGEERDADRPRLEHGQPQHRRLGDAVEDDAEHDGEGGPARLLAGRALAPARTEPVEQRVADVEDTRTGGEPEADADAARRRC